jgi:hypothetical protein
MPAPPVPVSKVSIVRSAVSANRLVGAASASAAHAASIECLSRIVFILIICRGCWFVYWSGVLGLGWLPMLMFLVANLGLHICHNLTFALALETDRSPVHWSPLKPKPAETKLLFHEHNWISCIYSITHFLPCLPPKMGDNCFVTCRTPFHNRSKLAPIAAVIQCACNGTTINLALL